MAEPLDQILPEFDVSSRHERFIEAPPERVWDAMIELDLRRSPLLRLLFALRGITSIGQGIDGFERFGFVRLAEEPPRLLILGLVGRFWTIAGDLRRVTPEEFRSWSEEGTARVGWSFEITPRDGGSHVRTETRIEPTGPAARRNFRRYWRLVGPFSGLTRIAMLRIIDRAATAGTSL